LLYVCNVQTHTHTNMKLKEIKQAVKEGKDVYWKNARYTVVYDGSRYLIKDFTGALYWPYLGRRLNP